MKKSQVLAALALAFALGVVVPVAGTYAQITPNTATEEQKTAIYEQAGDILDDAARLENYAEYKGIYNALEGDNGLIKKLDDIAASQLKILNRGLSNNQATNVYINRANTLMNNTGLKDLETNGNHAALQRIPAFTTYGTLKAAYDAIQSAVKAAEANVAILQHNYTYADGNLVDQLLKQYDGVIYDLTTRNADAMIAGANNTTSLEATLAAALNSANIHGLISNIEAIDEDAADAMKKNTEWVANPTTGIEKATDLGLIIKTAKALPKYKLAGAVAEAEANVAMIPEDQTTEVDYNNAVSYIAALKNAIKAYETGKTDGTGDGTNKPGDDEKDPSAPDTGILANTEGSASTTLAMVAGIATALTAAGAGVVAYRNARRSSRK